MEFERILIFLFISFCIGWIFCIECILLPPKPRKLFSTHKGKRILLTSTFSTTGTPEFPNFSSLLILPHFLASVSLQKQPSVKGARENFPAGPVFKPLCFHCRGPRVQSLVGELRSHKSRGAARKKKVKKGKNKRALLWFQFQPFASLLGPQPPISKGKGWPN